MEFRDDGLPRSDLLRIGGFLSGALLATPLFFAIFGATANALSRLPIGTSVPGVELLTLALAAVAATVASATTLFGYGWVHEGSRWRPALFAVTVLGTLSAGLFVTVLIVVDAFTWGLEEDNAPALAFGVAGTLALGWIGVRGTRFALAGYRDAA